VSWRDGPINRKRKKSDLAAKRREGEKEKKEGSDLDDQSEKIDKIPAILDM